ncbi:transmembrane protein 18 isoform X2 [Medicago truncatula]|uniref:transmembrane protein 18 isoform X2 n=1 Tax=Medicago truncatula TaxID=3880 RepID=UPI000D2F30D6|nr:transmembrane protein 18-like isoform X2 [Medicago truncatula]
MSDLVQKISSELRSNLRPAKDNFLGFFHAIDWKEPWLLGLLSFYVLLLLVTIISRKNTNFQMCLFLLTLAGVYLAESLNSILGENWKSFSTQNYFDPSGVFISTHSFPYVT